MRWTGNGKITTDNRTLYYKRKKPNRTEIILENNICISFTTFMLFRTENALVGEHQKVTTVKSKFSQEIRQLLKNHGFPLIIADLSTKTGKGKCEDLIGKQRLNETGETIFTIG